MANEDRSASDAERPDPPASLVQPPEVLKPRISLWPFAILALAVLWALAIRVPLIINASAALDSDLAVDGLTLLEWTQGHFRWHYPGTPHIGIAPVLASLPQALMLGATPETLVSGGAVIHILVMVACFALAWRCDGPKAACWSLVPLTFASTGLIWLSGRITGGHLLSVAMHAGIFLGFHLVSSRPTFKGAFLFGCWAGLSLWVDTMTALSLAAVLPAAGFVWFRSGHRWRALPYALVFALGLPVGLAPRWIGDRVDPYDAYHEQFSILWDRTELIRHARLMVLDCLPRLVAGHRIPNLRSDPPPITIPSSRVITLGSDRRGTFDEVPAHLAVILFLTSFIFLFVGKNDLVGFSTRMGLLIACALVMVGFVLNRNIFNSDNYRYLVFLIVPWSLGIGRMFARLSGKGTGGLIAAGLLAAIFGGVMTVDAALWYGRFGWVAGGRPVVASVDRPELLWLQEHREIDGIIGSYWDVYLYSFLTQGQVKGIPYPIYPNRFPEWSKLWPGGRPHYLLVARGRSRDGMGYRVAADHARGRVLFQGQHAMIQHWPGAGLHSP